MAVTQGTQLETTQALAEAYGAAWNAHDLEGILGMHSADAVFHLHVEPFTAAEDPVAIREQFTAIFLAWPDIRFDTVRRTVREGLFVHEFTIVASLVTPWPVGHELAQPTNGPISFAGVDVIPCEGGLVRRKDTYLDAMALRRGLGL